MQNHEVEAIESPERSSGSRKNITEKVIHIETCRECKNHRQSTWHDEMKYEANYASVKAAIEELIPGIVVEKNINEVRVLGGFEIMHGDKVLFSKRTSGLWPNAKAVAQRVQMYFDDLEQGKDVTGYGTQKEKAYVSPRKKGEKMSYTGGITELYVFNPKYAKTAEDFGPSKKNENQKEENSHSERGTNKSPVPENREGDGEEINAKQDTHEEEHREQNHGAEGTGDGQKNGHHEESHEQNTNDHHHHHHKDENHHHEKEAHQDNHHQENAHHEQQEQHHQQEQRKEETHDTGSAKLPQKDGEREHHDQHAADENKNQQHLAKHDDKDAEENYEEEFEKEKEENEKNTPEVIHEDKKVDGSPTKKGPEAGGNPEDNFLVTALKGSTQNLKDN